MIKIKKIFFLSFLLVICISCQKESKVTFQYREAQLSQSSKILLSNYITGYGINPNEVRLHLFNNTNNRGQYINNYVILKTIPKSVDSGKVDTIKNLFFTRYKGFSVYIKFGRIDERFFKFKEIKKESVDLAKEKLIIKQYPYGEFPIVWHLKVDESFIYEFETRDEGNRNLGDNIKERVRKIKFDNKY
jgi:hypothetical protein